MSEIISIEKLRELAKVERPTFEHELPGVGVITYRAITGAELESVVALAKGDDGKFRQFLVNQASVEPKITSEMWHLLGQLPPKVRGGLVVAILKGCGLTEDALDDATKSA